MTDDHLRRGFGQRLWSTAKVTANAAKLAARQVATGRGDPDGAIGEALFSELDRMKGVAMKVGQILSYFDGALPERTHAALRRLQTGAEPVSYETVVRVVEEAFGAPLRTLFDEFERGPIAAASIGQVHRARYADERVAVKVQYPGIGDTMVADLTRLKTFSKLASLATAVDGPSLVSELAERMRQECDYEFEAHQQNEFSEAFREDPAIDIPRAFPERTRATVLTSEWRDGDDFYTFAEKAPAEHRNAAGLTLARFAYRSLFGLKRLNADPHPGNYLFPSHGPVVFLDFGCVKVFTEAYVERERQLARVVIGDQRQLFREAAIATKMIPDPDHFDFDLHWQMLCHQYAPYKRARFRFTRDFIKTGMEFSHPSNPNLRKLAIPPAWIWVQRLVWGLHAVLARLDCEGPFGEVLERALEAPR